MRKSTLGNMLLLCGLTAGAVGIGTAAPPQATNNTMTMNNMMSNDMMADSMPVNEMTPAPAPSPTPDVTTNELSPKPM